MTEWEYVAWQPTQELAVVQGLNEWGKEGWELSHVLNVEGSMMFLMKRPVRPSRLPDGPRNIKNN